VAPEEAGSQRVFCGRIGLVDEWIVGVRGVVSDGGGDGGGYGMMCRKYDGND
jgi:hypothetical protein